MEILAIRFIKDKFGLSINRETGRDEWCAYSGELTQFFNRADAEKAMIKFGLDPEQFEIIPHPHQHVLKRQEGAPTLKPVAGPRFKP